MSNKIEAILPLVKELTEKYTGKASTSVTYEVAQQLMGAALYCINENRSSDSQDPKFEKAFILYVGWDKNQEDTL